MFNVELIMGYGRDEAVTEEFEEDLSESELKAARYFDMDEGQWLEETHQERNRLEVLARRMKYN